MTFDSNRFALADPGGTPNAGSSKGPFFFRFDIQIARNVAASWVGAPYEKTWIPTELDQ